MPLEPILMPDWRTTAHYEWLRTLGRPAFAWEVLRRNPRYRADALHALSRLPSSRMRHVAVEAGVLMASWGLAFPG